MPMELRVRCGVGLIFVEDFGLSSGDGIEDYLLGPKKRCSELDRL